MKKSLLLVFVLIISQMSFAQIVGDCTAPYNTPESLVEILVGEGVQYSNVTFSGFDCSAGYFNGTSNLDFQTGLVMATDGLDAITPGSFGFGGGGGWNYFCCRRCLMRLNNFSCPLPVTNEWAWQ